MHWALILTLAMLAGNPAQNSTKAALKPGTARSSQPNPKLLLTALPSPSEDANAESELLQLANQSRQEAGLPVLRLDETLTEAARAHARLMVESGHLAHQFPGESGLLQRIAEVSPLHLDRAGENVAYNSDAESAHDALMHSPPHRQNLLDPTFNVAGFAAVWSDGRLYVVQDFGHELPAYSAEQTEQLVAQAIGKARQRVGLPQLTKIPDEDLDRAACALAQQNQLDARGIGRAEGSRGAVTYTQSRPEILPQGALRAVRDQNARQFAVGTCYARSAQNPAGKYWVAILLY